MILLVEDHPATRYALAWILRNRGHDVSEAADGSQALALLNTRDFDLVITDLEIPLVSGLDLAIYTQARWPHMPVLVMSGRPVSEYAGKLGSVRGLREFVQKPLDGAALTATVQRLLAARSSQRSTTRHRGPASRRKIGSQTWHVCTNCKDWPDSEFEEIAPDTAAQLELCNECRLMLADGDCR